MPMPAKTKQRKPFFKVEFSPENFFIQIRRPKRGAMMLAVLALLLIILLAIAVHDQDLRSKALELAISIIEAILTFFGMNLKNK
jgi:hypothetical protein